jgi:recombination protein RecA
MARKITEITTANAQTKSLADDIASQLIKDLNKTFGTRVAYNLSEDEAPTIVKRWIDTGSIQLDYAIRNGADGGYPEGRIIEISGLPSSGKSHLAYHAAAVTQKLGGLVVYVDTENATPVAKLANMGIDVAHRFVYCDTHCTEEVFAIIESTILKAKQIIDKNVPILVIWDSVAATSPKAELEGEYDQNSMGLQARVISKGMRKITGVIGQNNVTLLCLNQIRDNIGVMHGDPLTTPGGRAIPFHASVRIRLGSGSPVKDKAGNIIGIHTTVTIKKNKVAAPFRKCEFDIIFGKGIVEDEYLFDEVRSHCKESGPVKRGGKDINISGEGAWKELVVTDTKTGEVLLEKKFYKSEFGEMLKDDQYRSYLLEAIDSALILTGGEPSSDGDGEGGTRDE